MTVTSLSPRILKLQPSRQKLQGRAPCRLSPAAQPGRYVLSLITSCQLSPERRAHPGLFAKPECWSFLDPPALEGRGSVPQQARWHLRRRRDRIPGCLSHAGPLPQCPHLTALSLSQARRQSSGGHWARGRAGRGGAQPAEERQDAGYSLPHPPPPTRTQGRCRYGRALLALGQGGSCPQWTEALGPRAPRAGPGPPDPAPGEAISFAWPRPRAAIGSGGGRPGLSGCGAAGRWGRRGRGSAELGAGEVVADAAGTVSA